MLLVASHDYETRLASNGLKTDAALLHGGGHFHLSSCTWSRPSVARSRSTSGTASSASEDCCGSAPFASRCSDFMRRFCGDEKLPCNCGAPSCRGFVNAAKRSMEGDGMLVLRSRLKPYTDQKLVWDGE